MCVIAKRQTIFKPLTENVKMNLNYDRLAAIKTALGNMQPGSARDILATFNDACGSLTRLIETLQCEGCGVRGEPATAIQEELNLAEEALDILCESALPVLILQDRAANPQTSVFCDE
jgi:hypothetical protein